jgi:hypothetical protein
MYCAAFSGIVTSNSVRMLDQRDLGKNEIAMNFAKEIFKKMREKVLVLDCVAL